MIKLFKSASRVLFFPKAWANAVSRWILGVHSPSGTISIRNTASPGDDCSCAFDVNLSAVAAQLAPAIRDAAGWKAEDYARAKECVRTALDGQSIVWKDRRVSVSTDWFDARVAGLSDDSVSDASVSDLRGSHSTGDVTSGNSNLDTTTWTSGGTTGVKIRIVSRISRNGALVDTFYTRTLAFDSLGRLKSVSAEDSGFHEVSVEYYNA